MEQQRSFVIVKPDALTQRVEQAIITMLLSAGPIGQMEYHERLLPEQVRKLYAHHADKDFFPALVEHMVSGPVYIVWMLADRTKVRDLAIGMRQQNPQLCQGPRNLIHATDVDSNPYFEAEIFGMRV